MKKSITYPVKSQIWESTNNNNNFAHTCIDAYIHFAKHIVSLDGYKRRGVGYVLIKLIKSCEEQISIKMLYE